MKRALRTALFFVGLSCLALFIHACSSQSSTSDKNSTLQSGEFVTDFIAGDGAGNGPGNGTDAGDVTISNDGINLFISIDMDDTNDWSFGNLHIYIGDGLPIKNGKVSVAPGQFPYNAGDGNTVVPGDEWEGSWLLSDFAGIDPLTILIHGEGIQGGSEGGEWTLSCAQAFGGTYGLYYGSTDAPVGEVNLYIDGTDIYATVNVDAPYLINEAHMYLDFASNGIPTLNAGSWPYNSGNLVPGQTSYTFGPIPLSTFGVEYNGDPLETEFADLTFAFHTAITNTGNGGSETATAWNPGCRQFLMQPGGNPKPHKWKSYTTCADIVDCGWVEGEPGGEGNTDTLWAADDPVDGSGWFPNQGINRWGWFIEYDPSV
ncbi:MAG: hypothetical protein M3R04_03780 [bacterium]|nr:hypothetical protein [bacterium]